MPSKFLPETLWDILPQSTSVGKEIAFHPNDQYSKDISSGDATDACTVCGKEFIGEYRKYNLRKHLILHTGSRPFACPHCDADFNQKGNLKRHIASVHGSKPGSEGLLPPFLTSSLAPGVSTLPMGQSNISDATGSSAIRRMSEPGISKVSEDGVKASSSGSGCFVTNEDPISSSGSLSEYVRTQYNCN